MLMDKVVSSSLTDSDSIAVAAYTDTALTSVDLQGEAAGQVLVPVFTGDIHDERERGAATCRAARVYQAVYALTHLLHVID